MGHLTEIVHETFGVGALQAQHAGMTQRQRSAATRSGVGCSALARVFGFGRRRPWQSPWR